jgi:hypothetical protein
MRNASDVFSCSSTFYEDDSLPQRPLKLFRKKRKAISAATSLSLETMVYFPLDSLRLQEEWWHDVTHEIPREKLLSIHGGKKPALYVNYW